jgi:hypothetical protein
VLRAPLGLRGYRGKRNFEGGSVRVSEGSGIADQVPSFSTVFYGWIDSRFPAKRLTLGIGTFHPVDKAQDRGPVFVGLLPHAAVRTLLKDDLLRTSDSLF